VTDFIGELVVLSGRKPRVLVCLLAAALWPLAAPAFAQPAAGGGVRLTGSVTAGFDTFQEKYSIVDRDTLDSVNEFRTQASLGLLAGTFLRDFLLVEGRVQYGDDTYETGGRLKLNKLFFSGVSRIGFEGIYGKRTFGSNSSYQFPNDYDRLFLRAFLKQSIGPSFALRLTDRLEVQDFQRRTEFDYDYRRNKVSVGGEFDWNLTTFLDMRVTHVVMDIPDSTEIEYQSFIPSVDFRHMAGLYDRVVVMAALERRDYVTGSPRSSFWGLFGSLTGERSIAPFLSLLIVSDLEWYQYDFKDAVYFDYVENRTALLAKFNPSLNLSVGMGPAFGFLESKISEEDVYRELGAKLAIDYISGSRAWITFAYEPGKRTYQSFGDSSTDQDLSLFSDYSYHRLSLFANIRLLSSLTVSAFADYQPEDHKREGDDATATLVSLSLTYLF
jgi:hypothetical protein